MKTPLTPHITEKSYTGIQESAKIANAYTFRLAKGQDKQSVKRLVEAQFKVTVTDVRIINLPGKVRRVKGIVGRTSNRKKAIVRLQAGQRIAAFDVDQAKEANA